MENLSNNFGERLRHLIAVKGESQGEFAKRYGIAQSQLYNWLKREAPPLPKHWNLLASYFGVPREYVAFGAPLKEEAPVCVKEEQATYAPLREVTAEEAEAGEAEDIAERIRTRVERTIAAAGNNVARMGWIHEQAEQHLRAPERWAQGIPEPARKPVTVVVAPRPRVEHAHRHGSASA